MAGMKSAGQQGRHIFEVAGPTLKLPASSRRASTKIEHWLVDWGLKKGLPFYNEYFKGISLETFFYFDKKFIVGPIHNKSLLVHMMAWH